MSKLITIIIFIVAVAGGGAGGYFAKQSFSGGSSTDEHTEENDGDSEHNEHKDADDGDHGADHGANKGDGKHGKSADAHGSKSKGGDQGDKSDGYDGINYYKFSRQFVIPIIDEEGVNALVLLDLNLEMDSSAAESFYVREPKLRDVLMEELLDLANEGRFEGRLTDRRNLDLVRMDLLNAVQEVSGDEVHDVLILDIMRQDL